MYPSIHSIGPGRKRKDLIELEGIHLSSNEILRLSLLLPAARIMKVTKGKASRIKKRDTTIVSGLFRCTNPNCITLLPREPTKPRFVVVRSDPPVIRCYYCGRYLDSLAIRTQLTERG